ncbi:hypothetical protein AB0D59_50235 [Streptomyces sp. NPDC048417]|uniref:hypothetical protein n=1 Tax=Streptomyces sp. NPDC048417 TaxID=3155387 RepID=UPI00343E5863
MELVNQWSAGRLARFTAARGGLRSGTSSLSAVETRCAPAYTTALEVLMRGSLDWSLDSGRYGPTDRAADPMPSAQLREHAGEV